ncbi:MAG TPA: SGNH/GDSL hydrolase family protein [Actinomycetota bacterium]|nr:SGNH/GDSL hydrolase family protein [Actinomycetota bacterium]
MRHTLMLMMSAAMLTTAFTGTGIPAQASTQATYYLSLGDSAAAGFQPPGRYGHCYADQLYERALLTMPELQLLKLGCPGETTEALISGTGSECDYQAGSQLNAATSFLQAHPGRIAFITINVGVNDVLNACLNDVTGLINVVCVKQTMPGVQANLATILEALREAALGVPIAGMSYWDPFLGFWTFNQVGHFVARIDNQAMETMNAGLVATYQDEGALVADVAGPEYFNIGAFSPRVDTRWGRVPVNVANACRWTWFCSRLFQGDPHPNTTGYGVIADAFQAVLPV